MWFSYLLLFLPALGQTVNPRSNIRVKESHVVPVNWQRIGFPLEEHVINLRIGLKQGDFAELERQLHYGRNSSVHARRSDTYRLST